MRRNWMVGSVAALVLVAFAAAGYSQVSSDAPKEPKTYSAKKGERFKAFYFEKLGRDLFLEDATVDKLKQSFESYKNEARGIWKEGKALRTKLREAVASGASDSDIKAILAEKEAYRERHRKLRADHQAEVQQILGTQNYAKYVLYTQEMRHKMRHRRHHRRGHHGWKHHGWKHHQRGEEPGTVQPQAG